MLYVYGERPITELFIILASETELLELLGQVQLENGSRIDTSGEHIQEIFIEAPLGGDIGYADFVIMTTSLCFIFEVKPDGFDKVRDRLGNQMPRYCECINKSSTKSSAGLVKKFYRCKGDNRTYLVLMTGDKDRPEALTSFLDGRELDRSAIGWVPYRMIRDLLDSRGFDIPEGPPHTWAEGRQPIWDH